MILRVIIKFLLVKSRFVIFWVFYLVGKLLYCCSKVFWNIIGVGSICYVGFYVFVYRRD